MANLTNFQDQLAPHVSADSLNTIIGLRRVDSVAELEATTGARPDEWLWLSGYYSANGRGSGIVRRTTSGATVNGATVFASAEGGTVRWERILTRPDTFHVDEWGCKGDDNTFNNTPRFEAIASRVNNRGYGRMLFGDQEYYHGASSSGNTTGQFVISLNALSSIVIEGEGKRSGMRYMTTDDFRGRHIGFKQCDRIQIERMSFDGAWDDILSLPGTIYSTGAICAEYASSRLTVRDCRFYRQGQTVIQDSTWGSEGAERPSDTKLGMTIIENCRFEKSKELYNCKDGGARMGHISGCHVVDCIGGFKLDSERSATSTVYANPTDQWTITDCHFDNAGLDDFESAMTGVAIQEGVYDAYVSHCTFENFKGGQDCVSVLTGQSGNRVRNVTIDYCTFKNIDGIAARGYGVLIGCEVGTTSSTDTVLENIKVSNCTFDSSHKTQLRIELSESGHIMRGIHIEDCTFIDPGTRVGDGTTGGFRDAITVRHSGSAAGIISDLQIKRCTFRQDTAALEPSITFGIKLEGASTNYADYAIIDSCRWIGFAANRQIALGSSNVCVIKNSLWEEGSFSPEIVDMGDASFTLALSHPPVMRFPTLATAKSITLPATSTSQFGHGQKFRIVKPVTTASLTVGSFTAMAAGTAAWMDIMWDGNATAWRQVGYGTLI